MKLKCRNFCPLNRAERAIAVFFVFNVITLGKVLRSGSTSGGSSSTYKCATDFSVARAQSLGSGLRVSVRISAVRGLCAERGAKEDEFFEVITLGKDLGSKYIKNIRNI